MTEEVLFDNELYHFGVLQRSGRYPWGSGETPNQRNKSFLSYVDDLKKQGLSDVDIAKGFGMFHENGEGISTTQLRSLKAIAKDEQKASNISRAQRLRDSGNSNVAIGEIMGINESSVRALLKPGADMEKSDLTTTANMLRDQLEKTPYLDVGAGTENHIGISQTQLGTAVMMLKEDGFVTHTVKVPQLGTDKETTIKVLAPPGTEWVDIINNKDKIGTIAEYSEDGGKNFLGIETPIAIDPKRVGVRYAEDGGSDKDGVIELRPGVDDISLGGANYAQTRIQVGDGHYLKGMAVYSDNLPPGVDLMFNTNKSDKGDPLKAMKGLSDDEDNPFGAVIRQKHYTDANGEKKLSAINIVNEEGDWNKWSKNLSSQMLSKQSPALAKEQLESAFKAKQEEFKEIMSLTNPTVKEKLLQPFSDDVDASAVHLKAAALPRQRTQVILPVVSMKDTEIYAPNFKDGERVVLVRYPHGGKFEIPELTVNNKQREAQSVMGRALDAVGINPKVAERLSGADFDGDTVLVIPNDRRSVKSESPLKELKGFDPQKMYPAYDGMPQMSSKAKQQQMGDVSNLITDMTVKGATNSEIARAVKHSMVVIDAEKHHLNYKLSAEANGIKELKKKYQDPDDTGNRGAATLISRASSEQRVLQRVDRKASDGGPIDKATGKKVYTNTDNHYIIPAHTKVNPKTGKETFVPEKTEYRTSKSTKMAETNDARSLISGNGGTPMEAIYANHANRLKALGNEARKELVTIKPIPYNPSAAKAYSKEVSSLSAKLNIALKNAPLERQAQLIANTVVDAKRKANPHIDAADLKKIKGQALEAARMRTGAGKARIQFSDREWEAVQSGAITKSRLGNILNNSDLDKVKERALPRTATGVSPGKVARAKAMMASGYTQSDIADALGVPLSTLMSTISEKG